MREHVVFEELLPFYAAGQLNGTQKVEIETHLKTCKECQADLMIWKTVSGEIHNTNQGLTATPGIVDKALKQIHTPNRLARAFNQAWQLLRAQVLLVHSEMWPVAAIIMGMGIGVSIIADKTAVIYFLSPLLAAATLAALYGPDHDPAIEVCQSTPTSQWKILLARMSIVSCYNLLLGLLGSLVLLFITPLQLLGTIILGWLGPMAFLSALGLLLSIWLGTNSAIAIAYSLWVIQYIPFKAVSAWTAFPMWTSFLTAYKEFWHNPLLLVCLSILIFATALWSANKPVFRMTPSNQ